MNLESVLQKMREADFFLKAMQHLEWERQGDLEDEPFTFYLSAFLAAASSVRDRLFAEQEHFKAKDDFNAWHNAWRDGLRPEERTLYRFLELDRNLEIHAKGSRRVDMMENVPISDWSLEPRARILGPSGPSRFFIFGPLGTPVALTVDRRRFYFSVDGSQQKVTEACEAYLALIRRMAEAFLSAFP